jgi:hypothetical protein
MRFLLDAHVQNIVGDFLQSKGHEVYFVSQRSPPKTPDPVVVADANQLGAIVITRNRKHFSPLISRDDARRSDENPHAGLISFRCRLDMWIPMLEMYWDHIVLEYEKRQLEDDHRIIIEIDHGRITFR